MDHRADSYVRSEAALGRVVTGAVLLSACVALAGGALYLRSGADHTADFSAYRPQPQSLSAAGAIVSGALRLDPASLMQLGVFILVLTPVARVAFSLVLFALRRDRMYTVITLAVLTVLLAGLLGAVA
jgi:uncharacterized membrane protein